MHYPELTILGRGCFAAQLVNVNLHHLSMRRLSDNLARVAHSTDDPGLATISFRTLPGASLRRSGVEMLESNITRRAQAESYFQQSAGLTHFGSITLPIEIMASVGATVGGCDLTPVKDALTVTPPPFAISKLLKLHATAGHLAEHAPAIIALPEAARGLEQALIGAMADCLGPGGVNEDRSALRHHAAIMRKFHTAIERHLDQPLYIPELCVEIGASERTLRVCCQEYLGMSPKRYLLMRRMRLVWRALRDSAVTDTTVTEVATQYGFWQFGRFAGEFKALFGESPSITLARPIE
jgi:AraC-like DNA-binding protein